MPSKFQLKLSYIYTFQKIQILKNFNFENFFSRKFQKCQIVVDSITFQKNKKTKNDRVNKIILLRKIFFGQKNEKKKRKKRKKTQKNVKKV
jgi:hypothetical protein